MNGMTGKARIAGMKPAQVNQQENVPVPVAGKAGKTGKTGIWKVRTLALLLPLVCMLFLGGFTYQEEKQRVFDNAGILTESQESELEQLCKQHSLEDKADYVILTSNGTEGKSARLYAADFYNDNGFGYNQEGDGTIYLIDMVGREMAVVSTGKCMDYITDSRREQILDATYERVTEGDYFGSCKAYLEKTSRFLKIYPFWSDKGGMFGNPLRNLLMAAVLSGVIVFFLALGQKSAMTATARDYSADLHSDPAGASDVFLRTVTTKSKKSSSSGGSGRSGGSTFRSSSGRSHSGSSRKF